MPVLDCFRPFLEKLSADDDVQYIKLTGRIPGVSWVTLFSEKTIRKGQKKTKNGATWRGSKRNWHIEGEIIKFCGRHHDIYSVIPLWIDWQFNLYIYIPNTYIIVRVCISETTQPILTYNISNWPELSQECLGLLYFPKKILEKVQKRPKMDLPGFFFEKNHFQSKILSRKSENVIGQLMSYE